MNKSEAFDAARVLHWYCYYYHAGQSSDLYRIQCELNYKPAINERNYDFDSLYQYEIHNRLERGTIEPEDLLKQIQKAFENED